MPKERRDRSLSSDRSRASPYHCTSSHPLRSFSESNLEDVKEWEDARCPVCMEHPHNAVLLLCSSNDKGCRPYMCDTSYRHANCLDQFCKAFDENSSTRSPQDGASQSSINQNPSSSEAVEERLEEVTAPVQPDASATLEPTAPCESHAIQKLVCPLCRGQINGWIVVAPARQFMNGKARSCACETCDYSGTYSELRKHARVEHPLVRPSEADPERQHAWRMLERERDLGDVLSTMQSAFLEERGMDGVFATEEGSLLTVFFLFRVLRPGMNSSSGGSWSGFSRSRGQAGSSRSRGQSRIQSRTVSLWGENYNTESNTSPVEEGNNSSESTPDSRHQGDQSPQERSDE
ncbi:hypothetical protein Sjap_011263 [Stephania japonica]|uniref:Uncharacterized protein n=1 Tax=Stephania japonica TaxID=461633 RepID=A0AAP0JB17_9MAGN